MRLKLAFAISALLSSTGTAQTMDRVFHYAHTESERNMQEIATAIRTLGDIRDVSVDTEQLTFSVHGTATQIALSEWLFAGLDQPVPSQPETATHELWPEFVEARYNLGSALALIPGRTEEAITQFQEALRNNPDFEAARQAIEILQTKPR